MISDRALNQAVAESVITMDQVARLRSIEAAFAKPTDLAPEDDENLRLISGFADIFVTIGIVLFLGALAFLMNAGTGSTLMFAGLACCTWLLAEFFTAKRRMALPSIVLLVVFVGAIFVLSAQIFASIFSGASGLSQGLWHVTAGDYLPLALAAGVTVGMATMHYIRFRVPITVAAGAAALCVLPLTLVVGLRPNIGETGLNLLLFLCGLSVFAVAMRFDMSDPERLTRRTDIAFWLHLLAAPLIVHPLIRGFLHGTNASLTTGVALGVIWIFLTLGIVAVIIDRRAILVSGLVYAGFAFSSLIKTFGLANAGYIVPTTMLVLGGFILLLSAGWAPLRRAILRRLPDAISRRLPHPLVSSQA